MRLLFVVDSPIACARVAILLVSSYTVPALTGEMVWTPPTLAGAAALVRQGCAEQTHAADAETCRRPMRARERQGAHVRPMTFSSSCRSPTVWCQGTSRQVCDGRPRGARLPIGVKL